MKTCRTCAHWNCRVEQRPAEADQRGMYECRRGPMGIQHNVLRFPFTQFNDWCWYYTRVDGLMSRLITWMRSL